MKNITTWVVSSLTCALTALLLATPGMAQNNFFSWVSHDGKDQNDCTINHPCRTFQRAHDVTLPDGEVNVLDPGDYGPLVINRSITVDGGNMAYIVAEPSSTAIAVTASSECPLCTFLVILRNFSIKGANSAITWSAIGSLRVEGLSLAETGVGIKALALALPPASPPAERFLHVQDTTIQSASTGLWVQALGGSVILPTVPINVTIERSVIEALSVGPAGTGLNLETGRTQAANCTISGWTTGVSVSGGAELNLGDSSVSFSSTGLLAKGFGTTDRGGNAVIRLAGNNIHDNDTALSASAGGQIVSFGNNRIAGNNSGEFPTVAVSLK